MGVLVKEKKSNSLIYIVLGIVVIALGVLFYFSPLLALNTLRDAAIKGDKEKISALIDFPALRENVKAQALGAINKSMETEKDNPFAALGVMVSGALADNIVNTFITPEGIAKSLKDKSDRDVKAIAENPKASISRPRLRWINSSVAYVDFYDKTAPKSTTTFEFKRIGLFSWQLKGIQFPEDQFLPEK